MSTLISCCLAFPPTEFSPTVPGRMLGEKNPAITVASCVPSKLYTNLVVKSTYITMIVIVVTIIIIHIYII